MSTSALEERADALKASLKERRGELARRAKTMVDSVGTAREAAPLVLSGVALATAGVALFLATRKPPTLTVRLEEAARAFRQPRSLVRRHGAQVLLSLLSIGLGEVVRRAMTTKKPKELPLPNALRTLSKPTSPSMSLRDPFPTHR